MPSGENRSKIKALSNCYLQYNIHISILRNEDINFSVCGVLCKLFEETFLCSGREDHIQAVVNSHDNRTGEKQDKTQCVMHHCYWVDLTVRQIDVIIAQECTARTTGGQHDDKKKKKRGKKKQRHNERSVARELECKVRDVCTQALTRVLTLAAS